MVTHICGVCQFPERYSRINRAFEMTVNESSSALRSFMLKNLRLCMAQTQVRIVHGVVEGVVDLPRGDRSETQRDYSGNFFI